MSSHWAAIEFHESTLIWLKLRAPGDEISMFIHDEQFNDVKYNDDYYINNVYHSRVFFEGGKTISEIKTTKLHAYEYVAETWNIQIVESA